MRRINTVIIKATIPADAAHERVAPKQDPYVLAGGLSSSQQGPLLLYYISILYCPISAPASRIHTLRRAAACGRVCATDRLRLQATLLDCMQPLDGCHHTSTPTLTPAPSPTLAMPNGGPDHCTLYPQGRVCAGADYGRVAAPLTGRVSARTCQRRPCAAWRAPGRGRGIKHEAYKV